MTEREIKSSPCCSGMYDPLGSTPLEAYRPWPSATVAAWESKKLELFPKLPWSLQKSYPDSRCKEGNTWYGYFKAVEEWLKIVEHIYKGNRGFFFSQVPYIIHASKILVDLAQHILSLNPQFFVDRELDKRVWKSGVQEVVRSIRKPSRQPNDRETYFRNVILPMYLNQMIPLYKDLADGAFNKILYRFTSCDEVQNIFWEDSLNDYEGKLVDVIYRVRICIGDMHRYAAPSPSGTQFNLALKNYEIAKCLRKGYGRAYYQHGVLSIMSEDILSAMYYFARAHFARVPTEGARNQILEIHSKSFNARLAHQQKYWYSLSKFMESDVKRTREFQSEIWILAKAFPAKMETPPPAPVPPPTKKQHILSLSARELFERFAITFTETLGKLFSRIGMDEFEEVAEESLVYFEGILEREPEERQGINFDIMMQVVGLIISIVQSIMLAKQSATHMDDLARTQLKHYLKLGVLYILELYSIVVERLSKLVLVMDWDSYEMQYISAAVMVLSVWLANNVRVWSIPHVRPLFSIRRLEKTRNANRFDQTDDVWVMFAELLTNIEYLKSQGHAYAFPDITYEDHMAYCKLPLMEECFILHGLLPSVVESQWYTGPFYMKGNQDVTRQGRAQLMIRLQFLHSFGTNILIDKLEFLKRLDEHPGVCKYICNTKLLVPKDPKDSCGLHERNYLYWAVNLERLKNEDPQKIFRPYGYQARTIIRKSKVSALATASTVTRKELPITNVQKLWTTMNDRGYRSDMVIIARRIVLDTNCFINKLQYVEKLVHIFTYPILLPVTVVLELKGLSKGGMKLREKAHFTDLKTPEAREHIKLGNEISYNALDALELIEKYIRYFKIVTTRGRVFGVNSVCGKIVDENFDPTMRNDNRILETCVYLEANDKETRKLDAPLRLYRKTVLLTEDRGLRVKCTVHEIPTKEIESFVIWVENYQIPSEDNCVTPTNSRSRSTTPRKPPTTV